MQDVSVSVDTVIHPGPVNFKVAKGGGFRTVGVSEQFIDNLPFLKGTSRPKTALESVKVVSMYALVLTYKI